MAEPRITIASGPRHPRLHSPRSDRPFFDRPLADEQARHQSLRAAIAWSHDLLTAGEKALFRRLALLPGGFGLDMAQVVHGGAYAPESVYPADAVNVVRGDPLTWKLKRNPRFTCRECGTRLFIDVLGRSLRGVNGYLLPPGAFQPAFHVQCQFAVRPIVDDLPHYKGMPKRFGCSDDAVGW